jgi:putative ABC transport system permease protein
LAFGIGTNTAIFSLINAVILRPLPFVHPEQLVNITQSRGGAPGGIDYPDFLDLSRNQRSFSSISVSFGDVVDLVGQGEPIRIQIQLTSASTFDVTNSPFILGRPFTKDEDKPGGPLLVVLTEHFWREHFHADPAVIGQNLVLSEQSFQVIGVCRQQTNIFGTPGTPPTDVEVPVNVMSVGAPPAPFQAYFPVTQRWQIGLQFLFLRTNDGSGVLAPEIRKIIASVDPEVPVPNISSFEELMAKHFVTGRLTTLLLSLFSSAALFLSAVGLYGVLTYSVNQRTREVGIRIALGAKPANITHLVMRQGLRIVAIGLAIGLGTGLLVGHFIESLLYGVSGHDPG